MEARNKPVVDLIDMIRGKLMEQRATRLPCIHAIAFIGMKEHPLWHTYIHEYFYVHRMAYDGAIGMLPGKDQWQVIHDAVEIGAPNTSRPRGRPKRRRLPNFLEKDKKVHKCSRCNLWGHHRSTCKNPLHNNMEVNDTIITQVRQPKRPKLQSRKAVEELGDEYEYSNIEDYAVLGSQISVPEFGFHRIWFQNSDFIDFGIAKNPVIASKSCHSKVQKP
ncbi:hypothetical protein KFK09_014220 [Dendrobium nobile]|uniref:Uncharacterized protein n=1 Tax=Dendrobium nobile TaxID=94219 RepID=A0A8T3BCC3_DENNO|nr:hypothetical protein KFK09_014220 [Dendrobium nobile]